MNKLIYEGKSKKLYAYGNNEAIMLFKDEVTAFNGKYKDVVSGKGELSAKLSAKMFEVLEDKGIKTHYICYMGSNKIKIKLFDVIPLEIVVRNYAYGGMVRRLPFLKPLKKLSQPLVEYHYKDDKLGDPLVLEQDIVEASILTHEDLLVIRDVALRINEILSAFWLERGLRLIDFKIEVAKHNSEIIVVDDITGDSMRLVDEANIHFDKEIYRRTRNIDLLLKAYNKLVELAGYPKQRC